MSDPAHPYRDIHSEAFLHRLMRRQLVLSILCASAFLVALVGQVLLVKAMMVVQQEVLLTMVQQYH